MREQPILLRTEGISLRFGGISALEDVDVIVRTGEIVGLLGPNGAGKTTLFNVFTGLYIPEEGEVRLDTHSLIGLRPDQITALGVCRTFQNIRLFKAMTAIENVLVGMHARIPLGFWDVLVRGPRFRAREGEAWRGARTLLERVGLGANVHTEARHLPYGDQRRLELARALASKPRVLLLDEPTAGMNPQETRATEELVFAIRDKGVAVLVIEHDMRFIFTLCDRVAVLVQGQKLTEGTPNAVQADERVIAAYLGTPIENTTPTDNTERTEPAEKETRRTGDTGQTGETP